MTPEETETAVRPLGNETALGEYLQSPVLEELPTPSSPFPLDPQQYSEALSRIAHVCQLPAHNVASVNMEPAWNPGSFMLVKL